jgi:hypothetical protein
MKNEILKRAMFAMPLSKESRNSGIMAGFEDEMPEDAEDEGMEEMPPMARTPQNPEILMNTLRGDMRSVDARMQELAQMVGEEAAMETPPEVLALLQPQLAAQQGGIGSLPQGQEMAPPPMGMPPPGMGMPPQGGMPPMGMPPQGGIPMPPGMEGAGPFPQGGAEQAPPTPDGMPPMQAAVGAFVTPFTRAAQFMGDKAAQYGPAVNQYMGNLMMRAQPTVQRVTGGSPPMPLSVQGRETLVQGPAGTIVEGVGTRMAPYTTMGSLMSPTFTEGIKMGVQRTAQEYPRVAEALSRMSPALGLGAGSLMALPFMKGSSNENMTPEQVASYNDKMAQLAAIDQIPSPSRTAPPPAVPKISLDGMASGTEAEQAAIDERQLAAAEKADTDPLGTIINQKLKLFNERELKAGVKEKTRAERTKEGYAELAPLFQEILGDNKEDMKVNALLMLADAGFKLATSRQPTVAMAASEAASGLPRGFMALMAQSKDRDLKIKSAALSQAFTDVQEQDKYAQQVRMKVLDGDFRLMMEQIKNAAGGGSIITRDGGGGLRVTETKNGSFLGASVDPKDPTVQSAIQSRFTLRDTDNPFVENRGQAPTTVETDKGERVKLTSTLRALDNSLSTLDNLKGTYTSLYSPKTWFVDKVNNLIVPIDPTGLIRPDVNQADAAQRIKTGLNSVLKSVASANDNGRVAVQEQEWVRETAKDISDPNAFFQNKELAAKGFSSMEATLRNARQQVLTQLGYESNDYAMRTPNTGTQNDPFVIPTDKDSQRIMFNFLGSTIGKLQDPKAMVYVQMPNNSIQQFNPTQLRGLIGTQ